MKKIQFSDLPLPVKFAVGLSFLFVWMVFEREVIERFHIDRFMPFYRVEGFCAWDFLAIVVIVIVLVRMSATVPAD